MTRATLAHYRSPPDDRAPTERPPTMKTFAALAIALTLTACQTVVFPGFELDPGGPNDEVGAADGDTGEGEDSEAGAPMDLPADGDGSEGEDESEGGGDGDGDGDGSEDGCDTDTGLQGPVCEEFQDDPSCDEPIPGVWVCCSGAYCITFLGEPYCDAPAPDEPVTCCV